MKKFLLMSLFGLLFSLANAQQQDADSLHRTAKAFMRTGDFDNALLVLNRALDIKPADLELLKDQAFVYYLKRDFAKSIEAGKTIIARPDADEQAYQILGLAYQAIAQYKEADKMYKQGIKRFPRSGILYGEYGSMLQDNNNEATAIKYWEKGIEVQPNYSSNYYYAVNYYTKTGKYLWAVLYGETFVNIESLTKRTIEMKDLLLSNYKKLFSSSILPDMENKGTPFDKAVAATFNKLNSIINIGITPESLTELRTRFILDWEQNNNLHFPYRLFDYHRQLLEEGLFSAYNQWLFGASSSTDEFQSWITTHREENIAFQNFQHNVLYKVPTGEYYPH